MEKLSIRRKVDGSEEGDILYCEKCGSNIQAGSGWGLFCPNCKIGYHYKDEEVAISYPSEVMSCVHCKQPLTIRQVKDGTHVFGRCDTEDCGDCFSMQDLCLITFREESNN